jgi:hypothetical protein
VATRSAVAVATRRAVATRCAVATCCVLSPRSLGGKKLSCFACHFGINTGHRSVCKQCKKYIDN